jgi:hypothetical protein
MVVATFWAVVKEGSANESQEAKSKSEKRNVKRREDREVSGGLWPAEFLLSGNDAEITRELANIPPPQTFTGVF